MPAATHIIGRQRVKVRYQGNVDPVGLRQMMGRLFQAEVPALLNRLFDQYSAAEKTIRLDKLELKIQLQDKNNLEEELLAAIESEVTTALLQMQSTQKPEETDTIVAEFQRVWLFYLENGYLPWWAPDKERQRFNAAWQQHCKGTEITHFAKAISTLLYNRHVRERLLASVGPQEVKRLIIASGVLNGQEWQLWLESLEDLRQQLKPQAALGDLVSSFTHAALITMNKQQPGVAVAEQLAAQLIQIVSEQGMSLPVIAAAAIRQQTIRKAMMQVLSARQEHDSHLAEKQPPVTTAPGSHIRITNAGLVLLANFLPTFFSRLHLMEAAQLIDKSRAVAVLRYLVYGDAPFMELEVPLEKIICGLGLPESIATLQMPLTEEEKKESELLLQALIEHWSVLKNTSPDGLRHNFLQREGRLFFQGNQWELTVQKQTHDILLDFLPWSFSMIKLPWMPQLLLVKWLV